jgi:hypothetical protein
VFIVVILLKMICGDLNGQFGLLVMHGVVQLKEEESCGIGGIRSI